MSFSPFSIAICKGVTPSLVLALSRLCLPTAIRQYPYCRLGGVVPHRPAFIVLGINIGPFGQQQFHQVSVTKPDRMHQRRFTVVAFASTSALLASRTSTTSLCSFNTAKCNGVLASYVLCIDIGFVSQEQLRLTFFSHNRCHDVRACSHLPSLHRRPHRF